MAVLSVTPAAVVFSTSMMRKAISGLICRSKWVAAIWRFAGGVGFGVSIFAPVVAGAVVGASPAKARVVINMPVLTMAISVFRFIRYAVLCLFLVVVVGTLVWRWSLNFRATLPRQEKILTYPQKLVNIGQDFHLLVNFPSVLLAFCCIGGNLREW